MLKNKWLGQKSNQGFYKKIKKGVIYSINLKTLEIAFEILEVALAIALCKFNVEEVLIFISLNILFNLQILFYLNCLNSHQKYLYHILITLFFLLMVKI